MMTPQIDAEFIKIMLCGNRSWIDDIPSSRFQLVKRAAPKTPASRILGRLFSKPRN